MQITNQDVTDYINEMASLKKQNFVVIDENLEQSAFSIIKAVTTDFEKAYGAAMFVIDSCNANVTDIAFNDFIVTEEGRYCISFDYRPYNDPERDMCRVSICNYKK